MRAIVSAAEGDQAVGPALWRIELFGGLRAVSGERTITRFRTQKTASVLAYLALHRERPQSREVLRELIWPDEPPEASSNALRGRAELAPQTVGAAGNAVSRRSSRRPQQCPAQRRRLRDRCRRVCRATARGAAVGGSQCVPRRHRPPRCGRRSRSIKATCCRASSAIGRSASASG